MKRNYHAWMVLTVRSAPNHDAGSWTEHSQLEDAIDCARSVDGEVYFRNTTLSPDGVPQITITHYPRWKDTDGTFTSSED
jgi:hypothetical protein